MLQQNDFTLYYLLRHQISHWNIEISHDNIGNRVVNSKERSFQQHYEFMQSIVTFKPFTKLRIEFKEIIKSSVKTITGWPLILSIVWSYKNDSFYGRRNDYIN